MNNYKELISSLAVGIDTQPALHVKWSLLNYYAVKLISEILEREINAEVKRSEYYYWSIEIQNAPLSNDEIALLNSVIKTYGDDYEIQTDEDYPFEEFCQDDACRLMSLIMPFKASSSLADDNGIWFFGEVAELPF